MRGRGSEPATLQMVVYPTTWFRRSIVVGPFQEVAILSRLGSQGAWNSLGCGTALGHLVTENSPRLFDILIVPKNSWGTAPVGGAETLFLLMNSSSGQVTTTSSEVVINMGAIGVRVSISLEQTT